MIQIIFFILSFTVVAFSGNRKPDHFVTKCEKQIDAKLKELGSSNKWTRVVDSKANHKTYRTPTKNFAQWIEIVAGDQPEMYHISPQGIREFGWNMSNCEMNKSTLPNPDRNYINIKGDVYTDAHLKAQMDRKESILIYVFSPRMTYSVKYMDELANEAEELGLKFVPLVEPSVNLAEIQNIIPTKTKYKILRSASVEILMRQMLLHFPSSLVIHRGQIMDPYIFGAMPKEDFKIRIINRLFSGVNEK